MLIHLRTVDKAHAIQLHIAQKPTFGETNIERPDEFEANRRRRVTIRYVQIIPGYLTLYHGPRTYSTNGAHTLDQELRNLSLFQYKGIR